jgi:predicted nucleotidyltransferase
MEDILKNIDYEELDKICKKYSIRELSVFGSYAKGNQTEHSDLDILVDFKSLEGISMITFSKIRYNLIDIFKKEVDLVSKDGIRDLIRDEVINSSGVFYASR